MVVAAILLAGPAAAQTDIGGGEGELPSGGEGETPTGGEGETPTGGEGETPTGGVGAGAVFTPPPFLLDDWNNGQLLVTCFPELPLPISDAAGSLMIQSLTLSPDASVATVLSDGSLFRFDTQDTVIQRVDLGLPNVNSVVDTGEGVLFNSGPDLLSFNPLDTTVDRIHQWQTEIVSLSLTGAGQVVLVGDGATPELLDVQTGDTTPVGEPTTNPGPVTVGPDGTIYIALADQIMVIPVDGRDHFFIPVPGVMGVAVADGSLWAMGQDGMVALDPATGDPIQTFPELNTGGPILPIPLPDPFKSLAESEVQVLGADITAVTTTTTTTTTSTTTTTTTTTTAAPTTTAVAPGASNNDGGSSFPWPLVLIGVAVIASGVVVVSVKKGGGKGGVKGGAGGSGGSVVPPGDCVHGDTRTVDKQGPETFRILPWGEDITVNVKSNIGRGEAVSGLKTLVAGLEAMEMVLSEASEHVGGQAGLALDMAAFMMKIPQAAIAGGKGIQEQLPDQLEVEFVIPYMDVTATCKCHEKCVGGVWKCQTCFVEQSDDGTKYERVYATIDTPKEYRQLHAKAQRKAGRKDENGDWKTLDEGYDDLQELYANCKCEG